MVAQCKGYEGLLHVYGNDKVIKVIKTIIDMILAKKQLAKVAERVVFHQLEDGDCFEVGDMKLECFDIQSTKENSSDSEQSCLLLMNRISLWSWRAWGMNLITSRTDAT